MPDTCKRDVRPNCFLMPKAMWFIVVGLCALGVACQDVSTVWTTDVASPDGRWIASALTEQHGGPGTAGIVTSVYLKQKNSSGPPTAILSFFCEGPVPHAYTLDNVANAGGTIGLKMNWMSPSHLDVTYNGRASLDYQVAKMADIAISVENTSSIPNTRDSN